MTEKQIGLLSSAGTLLFWGILLPSVSHHILKTEDALSVLFMRMTWAFLIMVTIQILRHRLKNMFLFDLKTVAILGLAAALSMSNWLIFIYSLQISRMNDSALGYFIMPLLNIGIAYLFLDEKLNKPQLWALLFASLGVGWAVFIYGQLPLIALGVAFTFSFYGLLKRQVKVNVYSGMLIELIFMLIYGFIVANFLKRVDSFFVLSPVISQNIWPFLIGFCSIMPLVLFAITVKKLPYSLVSILQWMTPSFQFILSVFIWKETFDTNRLITFIFIWIGLAFYGYTLLNINYKKHRKIKSS